MGKTFFISDLHFGHENVIKFDNRPFETVEEMDAELIRRWNAKVGKDDLVYVLGDMIWKSRNGEAEQLIKSLNGQIILIKGNHDRFLHNAKAKAALAGVKDYDDITVTLEDGTTRRCILSHYYIPMYNGHFYTAIHLHGHSHNTEEASIELQISKMLNSRGYRNEIYNVGCMYWNYEPVTLDEILADPRNKHDALEDNFGDVLMCAIKGAINMPSNTIDIVYSFIMDNLQFIAPTTLEHIKQYVWEWDTEVSNKLLEKIQNIQKGGQK